MKTSSFYETERALSEYLLFHYGTARTVLPWSFGPADALDFAVRCVSSCLDLTRLRTNARALDLGCAVGRSTFELARHCASVIGIDHSLRFIEAARHLQSHGALPFTYIEEGRISSAQTAIVPDDIDRSRVSFETGDGHRLRESLGRFDVVLMANLLDRLHSPHSCLEALPMLVADGGQLIITTPCTWLEEYTPQSNWIGGFLLHEQPVTTLDNLQRLLQPHFTLTRKLDLPFLIREHARKYQWSVAQATTWIRA